MSGSVAAPLILGEDGYSQWKALGPDWAAFVNFWSKTHNHDDLQNRLYPDVLNLQLPHDAQKYALPIVDMSNQILVTQSYVDLYERIKTGLELDGAMRDGARITRRVVERNGVIITGQPGTGKSCSLWYIAIRLLQDCPLEPLLFIQQGSVLLFYQGNAYTLPVVAILASPFQLPIHIFSFRRNGPSCIALIDGNEPDAPDYLKWDFLLPIFATSPHSQGMRNFVKKRNPFIWGMPTWTRLELRKGFEIQRACARIKEILLGLEPGVLQAIDFCEHIDQKDWPPLRAEPEAEADPLTTGLEQDLMGLVETGVRRVGWVPRDIYRFMAQPMNFGKFPDSTVQGDLYRVDLLQILRDLVGPLKIPTSPLSHQVFMQHALSQNNLEDTKFAIHFRTKSTEDFYLKEMDWPYLREVLRITQKYPKAHSLRGIVFEAVAHRVLPTLSCVPLFPMTEEAQKETGAFVCYLSAKNSPETIEVDFTRTNTIPFQSLAPKRIQLSDYYQGCRRTPLVDGFLLSKTRARKAMITLYLLLFTTSPKKEPHSLQSLIDFLIIGPIKLFEIVEEVKLTYKLPVKVCFVLVGPAGDLLKVEPEQRWKLPHSDRLGFPYKVYTCGIPIPESLPHLGASEADHSSKHFTAG